MLESYAQRYRENLMESVVPFWLENSLDNTYGGYFTCLDREGKVYDSRKYMWLQGREVWMFSKLYNAVEKREDFLNAAKLGLDFIRKFGKDEHGRVYFSLTREGKPVFFQRKIYGSVFYMLGLLEYSKATGDAECRQEAVEMFWKITEWIKDPSLIGRPVFEGAPKASSLADVMVLASMAIELAEVDDDPRYIEIIRLAMQGVNNHCDVQRNILIENAEANVGDLDGLPEGRMFNPGHSIEVAWFLLHMLEICPDEKLQTLALDVLAGSLEFGWDKEFGGLYYFMDVENRPTLQLESNMKLWWPHTEAIYALVLAYSLTKNDKWVRWLEKVDEYTFSHFVDKEFGEWFGYCDRRGNLALESKGGNYKGCFHVPRAMLMSYQKIEEMNAKG